jgi:16S rRNA (adenine1518-N6/adenine1519-N6)-dimethyltransferase
LAIPSTIREILQAHGIRLQKALGQHFLADSNVLERIVEAIEPKSTDIVVEIGAGLGTLTVAVAPLVHHVFAVEVAPKLIPVLKENLKPLANVQVIAADFLSLKLSDFGKRLVVIGNLPYQITSEVLLKLIRERKEVARAVVMVQWEVGKKLVAPPGPAVTRLGVHLRAYYELELLRRISRTVFFPPPEVDGALLRLSPLPSPRIRAQDAAFEHTLALLFGHRRKTLRQALAAHFPRELVDQILAEAALAPRVRGEALDLPELDRLAQALARLLGSWFAHGFPGQ